MQQGDDYGKIQMTGLQRSFNSLGAALVTAAVKAGGAPHRAVGAAATALGRLLLEQHGCARVVHGSASVSIARATARPDKIAIVRRAVFLEDGATEGAPAR